MFNCLRIPRNLYRTSMNYVGISASGFVDTSPVIYDIFCETYDAVNISISFLGFNEFTVAKFSTVDTLQNSRVIPSTEVVSANVTVSAFNQSSPFLNDSSYIVGIESTTLSSTVSAFNTESNRLTAFDKGISYPVFESGSLSPTTSAFNTESNRLTAFDKGISCPVLDNLLVRSTTIALNLGSDYLTNFDRGISYPVLDNLSLSPTTSAFNTESNRLTAFDKGISYPVFESGSLSYNLTSLNLVYESISSFDTFKPERPNTETGTQVFSTSASCFTYETFTNFEENAETSTESGNSFYSVLAENTTKETLSVSSKPVEEGFSNNLTIGINSLDPGYLAKSFVYSDPDAEAYIAQVEAADGQSLEFGVKNSITEFVNLCKVNGLWTSIQHCFLLMGARTLNGALIPLKGTAPTNSGFTSSSYNRKILQGNGTAFLNLNVNTNTFTANNHHVAIYKTNSTGSSAYVFGDTGNAVASISMFSTGITRHRNSSSYTPTGGIAIERTGMYAINRISDSNSYYVRYAGINQVAARVVQVTPNNPLTLFKAGSTTSATTAGISFYSQGTSMPLASMATYDQIVNQLVYNIRSYSV